MEIETHKAKQYLLQSQIEAYKTTQLERALAREKTGMKLQDLADQRLQVKIQTEEVRLSTDKARLDGLRIDHKKALGETKYKQASLTIQEHLWATELSTDEFKLSRARQQLADLKGAISILGATFKEYSPNSIGGSISGN